MNIPNHFRLTTSQGCPWLNAYLLKHAAKLPSSEALKISKKLLKEVDAFNLVIKKTGLPAHLELAYVHPSVNVGVFLKPTSPAIAVGSFIGVYTGLYELVDSEITTGTSYAYDVAQELSLKKTELSHVSRHHVGGTGKKDYSIQTNAFEMGNFTRYINHSSISPNIEAVVSKFPDGRMEILLFALRTIQPGEQLLSCYGGQYWQALGIIPGDMKPDTYLLTSSSKAKLSNPLPALPLKQIKRLTSLRNVLIDVPSTLTKHPLIKALKKRSRSITKKLEDEISAFEEMVLERGLPRKWEISSQKGSLKVVLKKGETSIRKNAFIGFMAGTLSLEKSKCSFLIEEGKDSKLFLDGSKEGNFLNHLPRSKKSNLSVQIGLDEDDIPLILLFASKAIRPGEPLVLPL